jgi:asparagine synthase (glutamine-hydrolysing)
VSAIAGIYFLDGRSVSCVDLERMVETLAHRGPDGKGIWNEGCVGLGHRMLWTTPESLEEKLPHVSQTADLALTADARIDNRDELTAALDLTDCPRGEITDSQLILAAYEKWDEHCPEKLLGDFAFAIWDRRRQRLFCARDHLGLKPFYYHRSSRAFVFASEIKALLSLPEVPRRLNEIKVADHLAGMFEDREITFYRDIFRLPAAHSMTVSPAGTQVRPYWSLDPKRELRLRSNEEYAERFRELFTETVRCRLRSAFPVGSLLSGGLDSSSIVCTARNLLSDNRGGRLHTFSAIFPSLPEADLRRIDERPFIEAVLATGGVEPHYVHADRLSPLTDLDRVLWHEDEAVLAPNLYMHWALYGAARQQGVRVLLDGIDGDTTVSHGLEYLAELTYRGRWKTLLTEATALSRKSTASFTPRRVVWEYGLKPLVPRPAALLRQVCRGHTRRLTAISPIINPAFARRIGLVSRVQTLLRSRSRAARSARHAHWNGLRAGLVPAALEMADRAAAAFALEPRYPFFDRRLMEFCLALPPDQKLHQGWTRVVMRRAMANILPHEVQWRIGKANLSPNFQGRLLDYDRALMDEIILYDPSLIEQYVDVPTLRRVYERYISQQTSKAALVVYGAITLALWLRKGNLAPSCVQTKGGNETDLKAPLQAPVRLT